LRDQPECARPPGALERGRRRHLWPLCERRPERVHSRARPPAHLLPASQPPARQPARRPAAPPLELPAGRGEPLANLLRALPVPRRPTIEGATRFRAGPSRWRTTPRASAAARVQRRASVASWRPGSGRRPRRVAPLTRMTLSARLSHKRALFVPPGRADCTALDCTGLAWTELDWTGLDWTAPHGIALHCTGGGNVVAGRQLGQERASARPVAQRAATGRQMALARERAHTHKLEAVRPASPCLARWLRKVHAGLGRSTHFGGGGRSLALSLSKYWPSWRRRRRRRSRSGRAQAEPAPLEPPPPPPPRPQQVCARPPRCAAFADKMAARPAARTAPAAAGAEAAPAPQAKCVRHCRRPASWPARPLAALAAAAAARRAGGREARTSETGAGAASAAAAAARPPERRWQ